MKNNIKFVKSKIGNSYHLYKGNERIYPLYIEIVFNWFRHKNAYCVDGRCFNHLADAKEYIINEATRRNLI